MVEGWDDWSSTRELFGASSLRRIIPVADQSRPRRPRIVHPHLSLEISIKGRPLHSKPVTLCLLDELLQNLSSHEATSSLHQTTMAFNARKRVADVPCNFPTSSKSPRLGHSDPHPNTMLNKSVPSPTIYKPAILHRQHPDSKIGQDFHWVPYPLGLMSFDSWHKLHHHEDIQPSLPFRCPVCRQERKATAHMRKVFLVASI
jgi:hypothetical protein